MKIKITIGRVLLTLLIIGLIYNLYYFHTNTFFSQGFSFINFFCTLLATITYIVEICLIGYLIEEIDWDDIFNKGFTIDLNRWKNKNNN